VTGTSLHSGHSIGPGGSRDVLRRLLADCASPVHSGSRIWLGSPGGTSRPGRYHQRYKVLSAFGGVVGPWRWIEYETHGPGHHPGRSRQFVQDTMTRWSLG